jgi:hypothetical protein
MAWGVSDRSSSASSRAPIGRSLTATNTTSAERHEARRTARNALSFPKIPILADSRVRQNQAII